MPEFTNYEEPPLRLSKQRDINSREQIENSLNSLEHGYFYHGRRLGKGKIIDLSVCTFIIESDKHIYIRSSLYSGGRSQWKEVITTQLIKHLQDIGIEKGIATAETRYFEVEKDKHVTREKYEKELLELIAKITR